MKKAIIIGGSSGIGKELATILSNEGYCIGITARRLKLLEEFKSNLKNKVIIEYMDVSNVLEAMNNLKDLIDKMGGLDLIVISAGTGYLNEDLEWEKEKHTIDVNVSGFCGLANISINYFKKQGYGHLVSISSIAANMPNKDAPSYSASKAFMSNYLGGLQQLYAKINKNIIITDVQPGFVDTAMAKGEKMFWLSTPQKAAMQIYQAIKKKKKKAYITKRWKLIAIILRLIQLFN